MIELTETIIYINIAMLCLLCGIILMRCVAYLESTYLVSNNNENINLEYGVV